MTPKALLGRRRSTLALIALVPCPIVWLSSLPLRLIGMTLAGLLALIGLVELPARLLRGPDAIRSG